MGKSSEEKREFRSRDRWLVFAFLLGPLAALTHLSVSYSLVPTSCAEGSKTMLHATTAAFLPLCLIAAAIAWTILRRCEAADSELWQQRTRWLATVAVVLAIFSAILILAMEIPNVILRSCD
jgi:hypothetical protein